MDRRVGIAIGAAAVVGALALPVGPIGIGWLLAALAVAGTALAARRRSTEDGGGPPDGGWADRTWRVAAGLSLERRRRLLNRGGSAPAHRRW